MQHPAAHEPRDDVEVPAEGFEVDLPNGVEISVARDHFHLDAVDLGNIGQGLDRGRQDFASNETLEPREAHGIFDRRMASRFQVDPEERMATGTERFLRRRKRARWVGRLVVNDNDVQMWCRQVRQCHDQSVGIDHLAPEHGLGAQAHRLDGGGRDAVGNVHPGIVPRGYPSPMRSIDAVLVDFDGTACLHDVAEHLLIQFGDPSWSDHDVAWERGEIGGRDALSIQAAMLSTPLDELIRFATNHCPLDPTFGRFVGWTRELDVPVSLVSDGFGFYIEPLLGANRLSGMDVITNTWGGTAGLTFANGHPSCVGCGTCKKQAVERARDAHGRVAFVGEDRAIGSVLDTPT
jgi:2-hydroxy-3-keto-5-methylthiopentenyl-1-phosphate phosphatase